MLIGAMLMVPDTSQAHRITRDEVIQQAASSSASRARFVYVFRIRWKRARAHNRVHRIPSSLHRASWYGPGFYGNTTACGQRFTRSLLIVAHRSWPCGKRITVCYRGRCVRARVGDRGPYHAQRSVDLGAGVARAIGFRGVGTVTIWHGWR